VVVAILSFWIVCDYPDTAKFLSKEEKAFVFSRLKYQNNVNSTTIETRGVVANDDFSWPAIRSAFKDWQVWLGVLLFWSCVGPLYGISLFLPTIIKDLGFKTATSQLLTVPIYVVGAAYGISVAYWADNVKKRTPVLALSLSISLIGFVMCISSAKSAVVFTGIFFALGGVYGAHPANIAIISNNLAPNSKRAAGTGIHFAFGNLAGRKFGHILVNL
jgi:cyanate permease